MKNRIIYISILWISFSGIAQNDSIALNDSLVRVYAIQKNMKELQEEQKALNFEKFFFEALREKAIENHDKAIIALENCQRIRPDNFAVNFELSKNYYAIEKYFEAIGYAQKALEKEPDNLFLLSHLKEVYVRKKDFREALKIQEKIIAQKPLRQEDLIILYIRNNQIEDARNLLIDLEKNGLLSDNLMQFKQSLLPSTIAKKIDSPKQIKDQSLEELKTNYAKNRSFSFLNAILTKQFRSKNYIDLETESKEALELFPSQPFVYLIHAKALNKLKKYEKAIDILQNGIDYVVEDFKMEANFYEELSLGYKGLGKNIEASKYFNLAIETRKKTTQ